MKVSINVLARNGNAEKTCRAFAKGIDRDGDTAVLRSAHDYRMEGFQACVLWGFLIECQVVIQQCRARGIPFVFIDLGYWRREKGYFKVAVNDRHPTSYLMDKELPDDRFRALGLSIKPWRRTNDGYILLAGMSGKAAWSWKLESQQYEKEAIAELKRFTSRHIVYRPKPNWREATQLKGTTFDNRTPVEHALRQTYCVVTHHSNVACEALLEGIPVFAKLGAASLLGPHDLSKIDSLNYPDGREQWAYNLAYSQWRMDEMASGECWKHLKTVGLVR